MKDEIESFFSRARRGTEYVSKLRRPPRSSAWTGRPRPSSRKIGHFISRASPCEPPPQALAPARVPEHVPRSSNEWGGRVHVKLVVAGRADVLLALCEERSSVARSGGPVEMSLRTGGLMQSEGSPSGRTHAARRELPAMPTPTPVNTATTPPRATAKLRVRSRGRPTLQGVHRIHQRDQRPIGSGRDLPRSMSEYGGRVLGLDVDLRPRQRWWRRGTFPRGAAPSSAARLDGGGAVKRQGP